MNNEESNLKNKVLMAVFKYFILYPLHSKLKD